jgi:hypothetical protein
MADTGLSKHYGGQLACVLIEGDRVSAIHRGHVMLLPQEGGNALISYLKAAAALEPADSPLNRLIRNLQSGVKR